MGIKKKESEQEEASKEMKSIEVLSLFLIIAVLVGGLGIIFYAQPLQMGMMRESMMYGDFGWYYMAKTFLSSVNIILLIVLMVIYTNLYLKLKSEFTLGLIIFSIVLLFYALTSNPLLHMMGGFQGSGLGPFAMLPDLFVTIALTILLYLSLK